jgi:hypothetical protein
MNTLVAVTLRTSTIEGATLLTVILIVVNLRGLRIARASTQKQTQIQVRFKMVISHDTVVGFLRAAGRAAAGRAIRRVRVRVSDASGSIAVEQKIWIFSTVAELVEALNRS